MSYTLQYSLGNITVADLTLNTQTSLGLPGRNYAGYGAVVDQNQLSLLENFASANSSGPANAIPGQTWYDSSTHLYKINTSTTLTPQWITFLVSGGPATFTNLTVTGVANIATANITAANVTTANLTTANITTANIATANIGNAFTTVLSTGSNSTAGTVTGDWTLTAGSTFQATYA